MGIGVNFTPFITIVRLRRRTFKGVHDPYTPGKTYPQQSQTLDVSMVYLGSTPPPRMPVANEGL